MYTIIKICEDARRWLRRRRHRDGAFQDQAGQGMVEYALILVLIAMVVIVILGALGNQVNNVFSNASASLGS